MPSTLFLFTVSTEQHVKSKILRIKNHIHLISSGVKPNSVCHMHSCQDEHDAECFLTLYLHGAEHAPPPTLPPNVLQIYERLNTFEPTWLRSVAVINGYLLSWGLVKRRLKNPG